MRLARFHGLAGLDGREFQLFGAVLVEVGVEVGAAAGFVEAGGADDDELLAWPRRWVWMAGWPQTMQTAESLVTSSARAMRLGTGPKGSLAKVVSRPARMTRLPRWTSSRARG